MDETQSYILEGIPEEAGVYPEDLEYLCRVSQNSKRILEIGTAYGRTTINLAKFSPTDAVIYTLDKTGHNLIHLEKYVDLLNKIKFLTGDSFTFDFLKEGIRDLDLVFVDGNHSFCYVISDIRIALQLLNEDGILIIHDLLNPMEPDVERALPYLPIKIEHQMRYLGIYKKGEL